MGDKAVATLIAQQPQVPKDPDVVSKIELLADYVVKNGPRFEKMAKDKQANDPKFEFLFGGEPGTDAAIGHEYYEWRKRILQANPGDNDRGVVSRERSPSPQLSDLETEGGAGEVCEAALPCASSETNGLPPQAEMLERPRIPMSRRDRESRELLMESKEYGDADAKKRMHDSTRNYNGRFTRENSTQPRRDMRRRTAFDRPCMEDINVKYASQDSRSMEFERKKSPAGTYQADVPRRPWRGPPEMDAPSNNWKWQQGGGTSRFDFPLDADRKPPRRFDTSKDDSNWSEASDLSRGRWRTGSTMRDSQRDVDGSRKPGRYRESSIPAVDEFGRLAKGRTHESGSDDDRYQKKRRRASRSNSGSRSRSPGSPGRLRSRNRSVSPHGKGSHSRSHSPQLYKNQSPSQSPVREFRRGNESRTEPPLHDRGSRGGGRGRPICHDFSKGRCFRGTACKFIHQEQDNARWTESRDVERPQETERSHGSRDNGWRAPAMEEQSRYSKGVMSSSQNELFGENGKEQVNVQPFKNPMYQLDPNGGKEAFSTKIATVTHPLEGNKDLEQKLSPPQQFTLEVTPAIAPSEDRSSTLFSHQNADKSGFKSTLANHNLEHSVNSLVSPAQSSMQYSHASYQSSKPWGGSGPSLSQSLQSKSVLPGPPVLEVGLPGVKDNIEPGPPVVGVARNFEARYSVTGEILTSSVFPDKAIPQEMAASLECMSPGRPNELIMEAVSPDLPSAQRIKLSNAVSMEAGSQCPEGVLVIPMENVSPRQEAIKSSPEHLVDAKPTAPEAVNNQEKDGVQEEKARKEKELKPSALLRVSLTEYVKEVLKPVWKEGHMSKEAFKTIAKKAVDKVISTLQPHQIPKTQEKVDHFMSVSRSKVAKLVQGYVDKYVKS